MMPTESANGAALLTHMGGLHARPAVKLTQDARRFAARVELATSAEGPWIDAKSIVRVMAMKATQGSLLHIRATGADAQAAVDAVVRLVSNDFGARHAGDA